MVFRLFILLLFSTQSFACELKTELVSLSGPMTMLLEELDLLKDKKLLAISTFHPITRETSARVLVGGLFLSKKELMGYHNKLFFYDSSRDLSRLLENANIKNKVEIESRSKGAFEVLDLTVNILKPHLKNCAKPLNEISKFSTKIKKALQNDKELKLIFFLGKIKNKLPNYIIANDGFVISLVKYAKLLTYKSELSYVVWSQKELSKYDDYKKIGVYEAEIEDMHKVSKLTYNFAVSGVLTPGISQIKFLQKLIEKKELGFRSHENSI